jgi:hypothetical protein
VLFCIGSCISNAK